MCDHHCCYHCSDTQVRQRLESSLIIYTLVDLVDISKCFDRESDRGSLIDRAKDYAMLCHKYANS